MSVLLLRLSGPMQSWGLSSRFTERDTAREPTKSGVIGLLCAALGKPREERAGDGFPALAELSALCMGVRVDHEGLVRRDFHTAGGGAWPGRREYGVAKASGEKPDTVVSNRYFLADAVFLVALQGDGRLVGRLAEAVSAPAWPLYLGRKGLPLGEPPLLCDPQGRPLSIVDAVSVGAALTTVPWLLVNDRRSRDVQRLRLVMECAEDEEGETRQDVPLSFEPRQRALGSAFGIRRIREEQVEVGLLPVSIEV